MPRKKIISDSSVLSAAEAVMTKMGPEQLTLAQVGRHAGIAAATLVQRFGSKRGMMLEIARGRVPRVREAFEKAREGGKGPITALLDVFGGRAAAYGSPVEVANQLAYLQVELADEEFRKFTQELFEEMEKGAKRLLWEAVKEGEIEEAQGTALARAVVTAYWGALLYWSVMGGGEVDETVRAQLEAVLAPYRR